LTLFWSGQARRRFHNCEMRSYILRRVSPGVLAPEPAGAAGAASGAFVEGARVGREGAGGVEGGGEEGGGGRGDRGGGGRGREEVVTHAVYSLEPLPDVEQAVSLSVSLTGAL